MITYESHEHRFPTNTDDSTVACIVLNSILELFYGKLKFVQIATERVWKSPFRASLFITEIYRRQDMKGPQHNLRSIFYVLCFLPKMVYFSILDN